MPSSEHVRVALIRPGPPRSRDEAVARAAALAGQAAMAGARLAVLPELFAYPLFPAARDKRMLDGAAEAYPFPSVERAREVCARHGLWLLVPTFIQVGENVCYNAAFVVDDRGRVAGEYRQQRVGEGEGWRGQLYFYPGSPDGGLWAAPAPLLHVDGVCFGLALGHDLYEPAVLARLSRTAPDALLVPAAAADDDHARQLELLGRAAAVALGAFVLLCLRGGESVLWAPGGEELARSPEGDGLAVWAVGRAGGGRFAGWRVRVRERRDAPGGGDAGRGGGGAGRGPDPRRIYRVSYCYSPAFLDHVTQHEPQRYEVPERPERLARVMALLEETGVARALKCLRPRPATPDELCLVHDPLYVETVRRHAAAGPGFHGLYSPYGPGSYEVACLAAGAAMEAAWSTLARGFHRTPACFALVRPPGHHAERGRGMGYCLFNHVAVAARWLQRQRTAYHPRIERVLIVDWDVHHGNGTQQIFYEDPTVLFCSLHQWPEYPGTGAVEEVGSGPGEGFTVNIPLPAGSGDATYLRAFREVIEPVAEQFRPDIVLVSAGLDCHHADPLSDMRVTVAGLRGMVRAVRRIAERCCDGRLALVLEGGYNLHTLPYLVLAVLDELGDLGLEVEEPVPVEPGPEPPEAGEALERVRAAVSRYWRLS